MTLAEHGESEKLKYVGSAVAPHQMTTVQPNLGALTQIKHSPGSCVLHFMGEEVDCEEEVPKYPYSVKWDDLGLEQVVTLDLSKMMPFQARPFIGEACDLHYKNKEGVDMPVENGLATATDMEVTITEAAAAAAEVEQLMTKAGGHEAATLVAIFSRYTMLYGKEIPAEVVNGHSIEELTAVRGAELGYRVSILPCESILLG